MRSKLALFTALLFGCNSSPSSEVREFLGPEIVDILETAERVESLRIDDGTGEFGPGVPRVSHYAVIATGPDLSAAQTERLRSLIFDGSNWDFHMAKACEFMPGVDFRVHSAGRQVDVLLCFSCDEWAFWHGDKMRYEDNDRARRSLLHLAREAFPDDPVLAGIK